MTFVAVTTRSKLRGVRFFPAMYVATVRARRQLANTRGIVSWASVIGSPTEFWTLTEWTGVHELQEFMRSGAHGDVMWRMPRWLRSFWLARWRPAADAVATADGPDEGAEFVLRAVASGSLTYDASPLVQRSRASLEPAAGVVVRVAGSPLTLPSRLRCMRRLRRAVDAHAVRVFVGVARLRDVYLFAVLGDRADATRLLEGDAIESTRRRWGDRVWAAVWLPENEFGHWDGARMRALAPRPRRFRRARVGTETAAATEGAARGPA